MISRIYIKCTTCGGATTARVQVGMEPSQPVVIPCPHCDSEMRFTLLLNDPPNVSIRWDENVEEGQIEGPIVNVGAGFAIDKQRLHEDMYFPSMELIPLVHDRIKELSESLTRDGSGPKWIDQGVVLGGSPSISEAWKVVQKAWRLHRTGRLDLRNAQIEHFWAHSENEDRSLEGTLFAFFASFLAPRSDVVFKPLFAALDEAYGTNPNEVRRLGSDLAGGWINERIDGYIDLLHEYFKAYTDYDQTLVYAKMGTELAEDRHATSVDFAATRMFYGNAFELLGSHLDFVVAVFNIISGRPYDQLGELTLTAYRGINKANRTRAFASHAELSSLVAEYDSAVRNASHHRWFKIDTRRETISYRSGGTGAERKMSYAEYLYRCNRLVLQLMSMACMELILMKRCGQSLG